MKLYVTLFAICLFGCDNFTSPPRPLTTTPPTDDMTTSCPSLPDLSTPPAACRAAEGISGTPLVCVDFDKATIADLTTQNWNFNASGPCPGWEIANGLLQVKDFKNFGTGGNGACGFRPPQTSQAQLGQYQRLTLSMHQRIKLVDSSHRAQIFVNSDTSTARLMWQVTGTQDVPNQDTTITVSSAQIPDRTGFSWLFKIISTVPAGVDGWQFDSIAVIGHP